MAAYANLQNGEFAARENGHRAVEHQAFVGWEYFDDVCQATAGGTSSTLAMEVRWNGSSQGRRPRQRASRLREIYDPFAVARQSWASTCLKLPLSEMTQEGSSEPSASVSPMGRVAILGTVDAFPLLRVYGGRQRTHPRDVQLNLKGIAPEGSPTRIKTAPGASAFSGGG